MFFALSHKRTLMKELKMQEENNIFGANLIHGV